MKAVKGKNGILSLVSLPEARLLNKIAEKQQLALTEMTEQEQRIATGLFQQNLLERDNDAVYRLYSQEIS
jgi:hypothetical protein